MEFTWFRRASGDDDLHRGRGIAAFDAVDLVAAEDWAHGTVSQEDLFRLETDGAPLWDGVAEIYVRPALPEEEAKWQASWGRALLRGDAEEGEDSWVAFLVPVVDPTGESGH